MAKNSARKQKRKRKPHSSRNAQFRAAVPPHNVAAVAVNPNDHQVLIASKDILFNQLRRDGPRIERSFDRLFSREIDDLSTLAARVSLVCLTGFQQSARTEDEVRLVCANLLINGFGSASAALQVLRSGYRLQPGIILRSTLESVSVVYHLIQKPVDLKALQEGKLNIPKTIGSAKKALPPFGNLYGLFTNSFSHISSLHLDPNPISEYVKRDEPLVLNLHLLRAAFWCLYVAAELCFYDVVIEPRYWRHIKEGAFAYDPAPSEREWAEHFLQGPSCTV